MSVKKRRKPNSPCAWSRGLQQPSTIYKRFSKFEMSSPSSAAISTASALASEAASAAIAATSEKEPSQKQQFGRILLDISNSVLPRDRLAETPSSKDGLPTESEMQIRSLACDLLQIAGKLLKIPQVRFVDRVCSNTRDVHKAERAGERVNKYVPQFCGLTPNTCSY